MISARNGSKGKLTKLILLLSSCTFALILVGCSGSEVVPPQTTTELAAAATTPEQSETIADVPATDVPAADVPAAEGSQQTSANDVKAEQATPAEVAPVTSVEATVKEEKPPQKMEESSEKNTAETNGILTEKEPEKQSLKVPENRTDKVGEKSSDNSAVAATPSSVEMTAPAAKDEATTTFRPSNFKTEVMAIAAGKRYFNDTSLSASGQKSCATCHISENELDKRLQATKKWPHSVASAGGIISLDQMIQICIVKNLGGKALSWDDPRLAAIGAFLMSSSLKP